MECIGRYPHEFQNHEGLALLAGCQERVLWEYPIIHNIQYPRVAADTDRAIFTDVDVANRNIR
jgi:hypothetical protein